jgi:hypothetical protein
MMPHLKTAIHAFTEQNRIITEVKQLPARAYRRWAVD